MNPKSEKEMFTRMAIFDTYCQTKAYKNLYKGACKAISQPFKLYTMCIKGITAKSYTADDFLKNVHSRIKKLYGTSFVHHQLHLVVEGIEGIVESNSYKEGNIIEWTLVAVAKADSLPFDVTDSTNCIDGFEMLEFDLSIGLTDQLKAAKEKLQQKQAIYKSVLAGQVGTSRQNLKDVLSHLECLVFRENETGSVKDKSKKFGMSHHTFRDKCEKAEYLINSKIILRFFPK